jgi:hypothetical protein
MEKKLSTESISVVVAVFAVIISIISLIFTNMANSRQHNAAVKQNEITQEQTRLSAIQNELTTKHATLEQTLQAQAALYEKRRFFVTLWEKWVQLDSFDPLDPAPLRVRNIVNTMDLVAQCWQADIVDKEMVVRALGEAYEEYHNDLMNIRVPVEGMGESGLKILPQCPEIQDVLTQVQHELRGFGKYKGGNSI